jgi:hypothetical protein
VRSLEGRTQVANDPGGWSGYAAIRVGDEKLVLGWPGVPDSWCWQNQNATGVRNSAGPDGRGTSGATAPMVTSGIVWPGGAVRCQSARIAGRGGGELLAARGGGGRRRGGQPRGAVHRAAGRGGRRGLLPPRRGQPGPPALPRGGRSRLLRALHRRRGLRRLHLELCWRRELLPEAGRRCLHSGPAPLHLRRGRRPARAGSGAASCVPGRADVRIHREGAAAGAADEADALRPEGAFKGSPAAVGPSARRGGAAPRRGSAVSLWLGSRGIVGRQYKIGADPQPDPIPPQADPGEREDLAAAKPDRVAALMPRLQKYIDSAVAPLNMYSCTKRQGPGCRGTDPDAVRAAQGRLSALSTFHRKSVLYGGFVWARRALNRRN